MDKDDLNLKLLQLLQLLSVQGGRSICYQEREMGFWLDSLLTAMAEQAQGGEWYVTVSTETSSETGYESSYKHLPCYFTALQSQKASEVIWQGTGKCLQS